MAGLYLDTSALGRVLLTEPDAAAIRTTLSAYDVWKAICSCMRTSCV